MTDATPNGAGTAVAAESGASGDGAGRRARRPVRSGAQRGRRFSPVFSTIAGAVAALGLLPLGYVLVTSMAIGWPTLSALVFRPRVGELLLNTVGLVLLTVPACLVIGVAAAWLVERTTVPFARVFAVLLAVPLAVPAFVNSYGWVSVVPSLHGLGAGVLISTLSYFPLVYLPCAAALKRLDPTIEEAAASLGVGPAGVFLRVVVPQLRLPLVGGSLLVGLHQLAEYGAFAMIRFDTFTTAIVEQYRSTFNGPAATALAGVLVLCCLVLLVAESAARGRARYARIGSGALRVARRQRLGAFTVPSAGFLAVVVALSIGVPFLTVARWLIIGGAAAWSQDVVLASFLTTVGYGVAGALVTVLLAFPVAFLAVRRPSRTTRALEALNYLTSSLPGIVTALAIVTVAIRVAQPLYQTVTLVLLAYLLMFLPRAIVNLRAGLAQVPAGLEESARSLGKNPFAAFFAVTARYIAPSALAGAALVFLGVVTELTSTLLLAPSGTRTLATQFWSRVNDIDYVGAAPYAMLMVALSLPVTYLLFARHPRRVTL